MISIFGLTFAFLLLASVLSYIVIGTKINPILKVIVIVVTTWYSIALYATPGNIAGWPKMVDRLPDKAWILYAKIVEPSETDPGGMYFWVHEKQIYEKSLNNINPMVAFIEIGRITPRAYGIPYDKELHKQFEKLKRKRSRDGGSGYIIFHQGGYNMGGDGNKKQGEYNKPKFKITNPVDLLPKKG